MVSASQYTDTSSDEIKLITAQLKQQKDRKRQRVEAAHRKALQTAEKEMDAMKKRQKALVAAQQAELLQVYTTIQRDIAGADDEVERLMHAAEAVLTGMKERANKVALEINAMLEEATKQQVDGVDLLKQLVQAERNIPFEVSGGRIDLSTTLGTETSTDSQELLAGDEALEQEDDELLFAVGCGDMDDLVPTDTEESLDS